MHIRMTTRALVNGGWVENGTVLDLPEAEANPVLEAGHAEIMQPMLPAIPHEGISTEQIDGSVTTPPTPPRPAGTMREVQGTLVNLPGGPDLGQHIPTPILGEDGQPLRDANGDIIMTTPPVTGPPAGDPV